MEGRANGPPMATPSRFSFSWQNHAKIDILKMEIIENLPFLAKNNIIRYFLYPFWRCFALSGTINIGWTIVNYISLKYQFVAEKSNSCDDKKINNFSNFFIKYTQKHMKMMICYIICVRNFDAKTSFLGPIN